MDEVKMDHEGCNGWAVYGSASLAGEDPENIHVAEVCIDENDQFTMNKDEETICKRKLRPRGQRKSLYQTKDANAMRTYLANTQNNGTRVCGICVSRFYGDNVEE